MLPCFPLILCFVVCSVSFSFSIWFLKSMNKLKTKNPFYLSHILVRALEPSIRSNTFRVLRLLSEPWHPSPSPWAIYQSHDTLIRILEPSVRAIILFRALEPFIRATTLQCELLSHKYTTWLLRLRKQYCRQHILSEIQNVSSYG